MSLSIFNFDVLFRALGLSARTHAWHAVITLFAAGILAAAVARLSPPAESRTWAPTRAMMRNAEILILGDSQIAGLPAESLRFPSINLAYGGTAFRTHSALLKYFLPQLPNVRVLLLGWDNLSFRTPDLERRLGDYSALSQLGLPWYRLPVSWRESFRYAMTYRTLLRPLLVDRISVVEWIDDQAHWSQMTGHKILSLTNTMLASTDVYTVRPGYQFAPVDGMAKMTMYRKINTDTAVFESNQRAFDEMMSLAIKSRFAVILLHTPTTPAFRASRGEAWTLELRENLRRALEMFPELFLVYWDASGGTHFPLEIFDDPNHLSSEGYEALADYLNTRLGQRPVPDDSDRFLAERRSDLLITKDPREREIP